MGVAKQLRSLPVWLVAQGLLVAVLFVVLCRVFFSGQSEPAALRPPVFHDISALDDGDVEQIDAWLQEQVALAQYPSLSVAIVCDGRVVYRRAFGFEDVEAGRQATPETSYHVASVTKVFTAALAVLLHERGVVNLDKPVVDYLPAGVSISTTPKVGATITLRQLASHTSGLPRDLGTPVQSVEGRYALEPQLLYGQLAKVKLVDDPGTSCAYSNLGIGLLGLALERAAGKPYDELLIELVCAPLQLQHTAIQPTDQHHVARGYSSEVPRRPEEHSYRNRLAASGGLITSAPDLAQFLLSQMEPGVFSREALSLFHGPTKLADGSQSGTAIGWSLESSVSAGPILNVNGGRTTCTAWIGFAPAHEAGVAVLSNCGGPDVDAIGVWLLERFVPGGLKLVSEYGYARVAPYSGVRWEKGRPVVHVEGQWAALVSIDSIAIDRIIESAQEEFGEKAQKRIAEDLVEVLSKMGHEPEWDVTLELQGEDGRVESAKVRMTEENRELLRQSAD